MTGRKEGEGNAQHYGREERGGAEKAKQIIRKGEEMRKPYCIDEDKECRTLLDFVEQIAVGVALDVVSGERIETIRNECEVLNSITEALKAIKS